MRGRRRRLEEATEKYAGQKDETCFVRRRFGLCALGGLRGSLSDRPICLKDVILLQSHSHPAAILPVA